MLYINQRSWNSLNICTRQQRYTPQYMFRPLVTEVILLGLSLGLRPLIRENVSSLWHPATHRVKKKKKERSTIPSIFSTADSWVRVQASVCPCVTTVSCDVAMTTDYAQRDLLEGKKKQPPVTESGESRCESSSLQISVLWGKRESKKEIYVGATDTQHLKTVWFPLQAL